MFRKLFKRSESSTSGEILPLLTDMHSHLIPGIDDGSPNIDRSIEMIRKMKEMGFQKLITTPHIQGEFYKNTPDNILAGLDHLNLALKAESIEIKVEAAAEYLLDDYITEKIKDGKLLTFGKNYVLVELSYFNPHPNIKGFIFDLQINGYQVILAHPERYSYWYPKFQNYTDMKDRGVFFQVNLPSISGYYSPVVRKMALKLIESGMVDFLGTDTHNMKYLEEVEKALHDPEVVKLLRSGKLLNGML